MLVLLLTVEGWNTKHPQQKPFICNLRFLLYLWLPCDLIRHIYFFSWRFCGVDSCDMSGLTEGLSGSKKQPNGKACSAQLGAYTVHQKMLGHHWNKFSPAKYLGQAKVSRAANSTGRGHSGASTAVDEGLRVSRKCKTWNTCTQQERLLYAFSMTVYLAINFTNPYKLFWHFSKNNWPCTVSLPSPQVFM